MGNRCINGEQQIVTWLVDDSKLLCLDKTANDEVVEFLRKKCKTTMDGKMKATRGKVHKHLGMKLDCSDKGKVRIIMSKCAKKIIEDFWK